MSDDETLSLLKSIDERLARLENKQVLDPTNLPFNNEISILSYSMDEVFDPASEKGCANLRKMEALKELFDTLGDERSLMAINDLAKSLQDIAHISSHLKEIENTISIITDSIDEVVAKASENGLNLETLALNVSKLSRELIDLVESGTLNELLDSGILDTKSIEVVGALGHSLAVSKGTEKRVGPMGILSALFNKDIQRSLGFTLNLATHFGRKLKKQRTKYE